MSAAPVETEKPCEYQKTWIVFFLAAKIQYRSNLTNIENHLRKQVCTMSSSQEKESVARKPNPTGESTTESEDESAMESQKGIRKGTKTSGLENNERSAGTKKNKEVDGEDWKATSPLKDGSSHKQAAIDYFGSPRAEFILELIQKELHPSEESELLLDFHSISKFVYHKLYKETGLIPKEQVCVVVNILSRLHGCFDQVTTCFEGTNPKSTSFVGLVTKLHNLIHLCCLALTEEYKRDWQSAFGLPWGGTGLLNPENQTIKALCQVTNELRKVFDSFLLLMLAVLDKHIEKWAGMITGRDAGRPAVDLKKNIMWADSITAFCGDFSSRLNKHPIIWKNNIEGTQLYPVALTFMPIYPFSNSRHRIGNERKGGGTYVSGYEDSLDELIRKSKLTERRKKIVERVLETALWKQWKELAAGTYVPIASQEPNIMTKANPKPLTDYNLWKEEWKVPNDDAVEEPHEQSKVDNVEALCRKLTLKVKKRELVIENMEAFVPPNKPPPKTEEEKQAAQKIYSARKYAKAKAKREALKKTEEKNAGTNDAASTPQTTPNAKATPSTTNSRARTPRTPASTSSSTKRRVLRSSSAGGSARKKTPQSQQKK